ncbi:MAG: hypothetical protein IT262_10605 [Saprospiraceae bacterium]|nr:hypothetical protein [Saprospiraceae bacterium]
MSIFVTMAAQKKHLAGEQHRNKIYQVLECFDDAERKRLSKFLHSPYFIKTKTLIGLYEALLVCIDNKAQGFDRKQVWEKIQPEAAYDPIVFRKYCSDLLKWTEVFMAQESLLHNDNQATSALLDFLVRRKIKPLYERSIREARTRIEQKSFRALDDFYTAFLIERHYYAMMDFDVTVNKRTNIEAISHHLDIFYWIEKLKLFIARLSQQRTSTEQYDLKKMEEIVRFLSTYPVDDIPELAIYYYSFLTMYEEDNVAHYYKLRALLDQYATGMPIREAIEIIDSALHYCTGKFNRGHREFYQEFFDVFLFALDNNIFSNKSEFAPWRYNNMVGVALRLDKLDWAERFVESYKHLLPPDTRQNTYSFNLARVYRFQKKHEKVLVLLRGVEYEDIGYNLISKMMLTITYFELDEFDALDAFIESFKVFLKRNEKTITEQRRTGYLNLLHYVRLLMRLVPGDKTNKDKLRQAIENDKPRIVNHEWLLEKLDEMD